MKKRTLWIIGVLVLSVLVLGFNLAQGMAGTIVLTNADGSNTFTMTSSSPLNILINQVASRIKVTMANGLRYHAISAPPAEFSDRFNAVASRIKIQFANAIRYNPITYPKDLIGDTTNPFVTQTGTSGAYLYITANEFTTMVFQYGFSSGSYPAEVADALFAKSHALPLSLFPTGQRVYYRVRLVDRSGNLSLSREYVLVPPTKQYIPFLKR